MPLVSASTEPRKLAAIMFADMVGYPDASGARRNEALALGLVPQGRQEIAQRFIAGLNAPKGKVPQGREKAEYAGKHGVTVLSPLRGVAPSPSSPGLIW